MLTGDKTKTVLKGGSSGGKETERSGRERSGRIRERRVRLRELCGGIEGKGGKEWTSQRLGYLHVSSPH